MKKEGKKQISGQPEEMVMRRGGPGKAIKVPFSIRSSYSIRWASREKTEFGLSARVRLPEERTFRCPLERGFNAAGRHYDELSQLFVAADETYTWCRDCFGRPVLYLSERFPTFDEFDAMYENRFYRWFFLRENGALTRIYYPGEGDCVYVTEDVANLETDCWERMEELGYGGDNEPWPSIS